PKHELWLLHGAKHRCIVEPPIETVAPGYRCHWERAPNPGDVRGSGRVKLRDCWPFVSRGAMPDLAYLRIIVAERPHPQFVGNRLGEVRRMMAVVTSVHNARTGQLPQIADAVNTLGFQPCSPESRQEQGRENRDNRNDHEQLYQGKS